MENPVTSLGVIGAEKQDGGLQRTLNAYDAGGRWLLHRYGIPAALYLEVSPKTQRREQLAHSASKVTIVVRDMSLPIVDSFKKWYLNLDEARIPYAARRNLANLRENLHALALFALWYGLHLETVVDHRELHIIHEQVPNPDSRVSLSNRRDELGMPRARLDWRLTKLDTESVKSTLDIFDRELAAIPGLKFRRTRDVNDWAQTPGWVWHHMGTTRMGTDPRESVVDADCRVHEISNLFVAGSSVFPCAATSSPTLTLLALAIRLACHIGRIFGDLPSH
jgi:choline dehydrogenase-like flavoprotein